MKRSFLLWAPVFLYVGFIFWVSSAYRPIPGIKLFPYIDKFWHTLEYAPLGGLLQRAIRGSFRGIGGKKAFSSGLFAAAAVGSADEFYQSFIPLKYSSLTDVCFDLLGAAIGQWTYRSKVAKTP